MAIFGYTVNLMSVWDTEDSTSESACEVGCGGGTPTVLSRIKSEIYSLNFFVTKSLSTPLESIDYHDGEKKICERVSSWE